VLRLTALALVARAANVGLPEIKVVAMLHRHWEQKSVPVESVGAGWGGGDQQQQQGRGKHCQDGLACHVSVSVMVAMLNRHSEQR
jgi:hypothetical protein